MDFQILKVKLGKDPVSCWSKIEISRSGIGGTCHINWVKKKPFFVGIAWAKKESLSLSHVQLFKPFLQVLLFFLGIVEATAEYSSVAKKKRAMDSATFRLVWNHHYPYSRLRVSLYFISTFFSLPPSAPLGHIVYSFLFLQAFLGPQFKWRPFLGNLWTFKESEFDYLISLGVVFKKISFVARFAHSLLEIQSCFLLIHAPLSLAVLQYTSVGNILHSRVQFHKEKSKKGGKLLPYYSSS